MNAYYKYIRREIEKVYIDNMIIKDFDEVVDKIFTMFLSSYSWEFVDSFEDIYAYEIIYNGETPIAVNRIDYDSLVRKDSATWIQHPDDPANKRVLYSTQVLVLNNKETFKRNNREEKLKDIIDEKSNSI